MTARAVFDSNIKDELGAAVASGEARKRAREAEGKPPLDERARKKNFAEDLSRALAPRFANALRRDFPGILPDEKGRGQESKVRSAKGFKKLDVNYSTSELGLGLGVSIKTINSRDPGSGRYTKNYTRADAELRAEASDYHDRQPYAVMVAVVFLPQDACDDGSANAPSSFGAAVQTFRFRAGRKEPDDPSLKFERLFIGLYDPKGGDVIFFDVDWAPPKKGPPRRSIKFKDVIAEIVKTYGERNSPLFVWDDGQSEPVIPPAAAVELTEGVEDDADEEG